MKNTHAFTYLSAVQQTYDLLIHGASFIYIKMFSKRVPHPRGGLSWPRGEEGTSRVGGLISYVGDLGSRIGFIV